MSASGRQNGKETVASLRAGIDALDDKILDLLEERSRLVKKVGTLKHAEGKGKNSIIRPGREAEMLRRVTKRFEGLFPKAAIAQIWRLIIASAVSIEEKTAVAALASPANSECYWLARDYFGMFVPITQHPTVMDVVKQILDRRATVGVLALQGRDAPHPWWSRLTEEKDPPRVFARLPFIRMAPSERPALVVIGHVDPESTGDDMSLWVFKADDTVSVSQIEQALKEAGMAARILEQARVLGNPTMHHYLVEIGGFSAADDARISAFAASANQGGQQPHSGRGGAPVTAHYLGAYAVPISFA